MVRLQLFRTKLYPSRQRGLFDVSIPRAQMLRDIILSRPSAELRSGYTWHLGNVEEIDDQGLYFALGRTTRQSIELWDEQHKAFQQVEFEHAPYTHVLLDTALHVCSIAARSNLAPKPTGIARQFQKLLNQTPPELRLDGQFEVAPILDPQDFIGWLHDAFAIRRFGVEFALPNPFDADEDFQKPLEKVLEEANGNSGKTTLKGDNLDSEVLEKISRSAAASGTDAEATVNERESGPAVKRRMKGQIVTYQEEAIETFNERLETLQHARELYYRIRETAVPESDDE